jgi:hypothetical protein
MGQGHSLRRCCWYVHLRQRRPNAGGVIKLAKRLWNAKSAKARWVLIGKIVGGVTGAGALVEACAP